MAAPWPPLSPGPYTLYALHILESWGGCARKRVAQALEADTGSFGPRIPGLYKAKCGLGAGGCGLWWVTGGRNAETGQNQALWSEGPRAGTLCPSLGIMLLNSFCLLFLPSSATILGSCLNTFDSLVVDFWITTFASLQNIFHITAKMTSRFSDSSISWPQVFVSLMNDS